MLCLFEINKADAAAVRAVRCGLHSGFPLCCMMFYVKVYARWLSLVPDVCEQANFNFDNMQRLLRQIDPRFEEHSALQWAYLDQSRGGKDGRIGYVRCPACILVNRSVKVRGCNCYGLASAV